MIIIAGALLEATLNHPYAAWPPIRSDGLGYHLWTRAILEGNLSFCQWPQLRVVGAISHIDAARGVCQNKYPFGLALLRFPVMAPLVQFGPHAPLVSDAEHTASLWLGALALALTGLTAYLSARRLGAPAWAATWAVFALTFGTGLFHYATYDSSFTHVYSALGFGLLLYVGIRWGRAGRLPVVPLFLIAFFLAALRSTNVLLLVGAAAAYVIWMARARRPLRSLVPAGIATAAGIALYLALQVGYDFYASGTLSAYSYGAEHFVFNRPMQFAVLAGFQHGLLPYYPVMGLALLVGLLVPGARPLALFFGALILAYGILYGFWSSWWLGGGFGLRGFVEIVPLGMLVLAVALAGASPGLRAGTFVAGVLCLYVTVSLMAGYWRGTLPIGPVPTAVYWNYVLGPDSLVNRALLRFGHIRQL